MAPLFLWGELTPPGHRGRSERDQESSLPRSLEATPSPADLPWSRPGGASGSGHAASWPGLFSQARLPFLVVACVCVSEQLGSPWGEHTAVTLSGHVSFRMFPWLYQSPAC